MIIVSQDKTRFVNFDKVEILGINIEKANQIACGFNDGELLLGEYATEERAKEVLQEIVMKYERAMCNLGKQFMSFNKYDYVYEMPEE